MSTRYGIVNGKGEDFDYAQNNLAHEVRKLLLAGWTLQGGVIYLGVWREPDGVERFVFSQAVVKYAKAEG